MSASIDSATEGEVSTTPITTTTSDITGRCLCGQVKYQGKGLIRGVHVCHCGNCARWGGGPAIGLDFSEGIEFEGPVKWYQSSDHAQRGFCETCGSTIFFRLNDGSWFNVGAGTLDDQSLIPNIESHIYVDKKPHYYEFTDDSPRLTEAEFLASLQGEKEN